MSDSTEGGESMPMPDAAGGPQAAGMPNSGPAAPAQDPASLAAAEPKFPETIRFEAGHSDHLVSWLHDWFDWKVHEMERAYRSRMQSGE